MLTNLLTILPEELLYDVDRDLLATAKWFFGNF